jgi:DNA mismatch repair protein MutS2
MRFDVEALEPLFELEVGKPGSSFALEVAKKIGLPTPVLRNARKLIGSTQLDVERVLRDLEIEKKTLSDQAKKNAEMNIALEKSLLKYENLNAEFEAKKREFVIKAKSDAREIVAAANKKVEDTIRKIKEANAEKEPTKQARKELETFAETIVITPQEVEVSEEHEFADGSIEVGDFVLITDQNTVGQVLEMRAKEAFVSVGDLKINIKLSRLKKLSKRGLKKVQASGASVGGTYNFLKKQIDFYPEIDIRGIRAEEAIGILESFIDSAILLGERSLRVIHGKGNGVLREITRNTFRNYKQTASMEDEHADRGGAGITVLKLNL